MYAAQAYAEQPRLSWTRRQPREVFAWIGARAKRRLRAVEDPQHHNLRPAWRHAVESWLRRQGVIEVSSNQKTSHLIVFDDAVMNFFVARYSQGTSAEGPVGREVR